MPTDDRSAHLPFSSRTRALRPHARLVRAARLLALGGAAALLAACSTPLPYPFPPMTFSMNLSRPAEPVESAAYHAGMELGREHAGVKACAGKIPGAYVLRHRQALELVLSVQPEPHRSEMLRGFDAAERSSHRSLLGGNHLDCDKAVAFVTEREACLTTEAIQTQQRRTGLR